MTFRITYAGSSRGTISVFPSKKFGLHFWIFARLRFFALAPRQKKRVEFPNYWPCDYSSDVINKKRVQRQEDDIADPTIGS